MNVVSQDSCIKLLGKTLQANDFAFIQDIYSNDSIFPVELRLYLSDWIEEKLIPLVSDGCIGVFDSMHQQKASNVLSDLIQHLDSKIQTIPANKDHFIRKMNLQKMSDRIKQKSSTNAVELYNTFIEKLEKEVQFIAGLPVDQILQELSTEIKSSNWIQQ